MLSPLFLGSHQGYVKSVTPKGCFISLSRKLDAKILLSNLSDGFIKSPEKEFPLGKLVIGKYVESFYLNVKLLFCFVLIELICSEEKELCNGHVLRSLNAGFYLWKLYQGESKSL